MLAAFLAVALAVGPVSPALVRAEGATTTPDLTSQEGRLLARAADTIPPAIADHDDVWADAESAEGALVSYSAPFTLDNVDGMGVASCEPASGSLFAIGTTTVTCTAADAVGNSASPTIFRVFVAATSPPVATSTASTGTTTPDVSAASTTPSTATSTPVSGTPGAGEATSTPSAPDPSAFSSATTSSAVLDPSQSDRDNTDFNNVTNGAPLPGADDPRPKIDASATSTEALASEPLFSVATSTNGTGSKIGGTIFTGAAVASTTVKNILNITRSRIDGPGVTNGSIITADTDNTGAVTTSDDTRALTGDNRGAGGEGDATIRTGKAVSSAQVLNVVNTNLFNSRGLVLFLNPLNGDGLDLRSLDLSYFWNGGAVGASPTQFGCTILTCLNSSALSILNKNVANVDNDVYVRAATGDNIATSTREGAAEITTGNAYATANVLNLVNTNFINSKYLVLSLDNFGDLNDDIVLPDTSFFSRLLENGASLPELNSSSYVVNNTNDENFTGTTTAQAITGGNTATSTSSTGSSQAVLGRGAILTGKAHTSSTNYTAANQTRVGGSSVLLAFHISGAWSGTVKGLPPGLDWRRTEYGVEIMSVGAAGAPGGPLGAYNSSAFVASSTNNATVNTDVNVWAETGNNSAQTENATSTIRTGDAYAAANVINMVNTNIVNRNWVFASFNIFGDWSGDIAFGGHSPDLGVHTVVETPSPIRPDSEVTYRFTVANRGDVAAHNVALSTVYDTSLLRFTRGNTPSSNTVTGTSWDIGTLAADETRDINMTARVLTRDLPAGFSFSIPLTATVAGGERDQNDANNTNRIFITVSAPASTEGGGTTDSGGRDRGGGTTGGTPPAGGGTTGGGTTGGGSSSGGSPIGGGGGSSSPPAGGGTTGGGTTGGSNNTGGTTGSSSGGGGGGGGGWGGGSIAATTPNDSFVTGISGPPSIKIKKTSNVASTTAPTTVAYKIIVTNDKWAGFLFKAVLTDTLYNPSGAVMSNRSWDLDTVYEGDEITLTYNAEFAKGMQPGLYKNVARVTGITGNPYSAAATALIPVEVVKIVQILPNGSVLGTATSTVAISDASIKVLSAGCAPLLTTNLQKGGANNPSEVLKLQKFLTTQGFPVSATGLFGPLTAIAVSAFQRKYASEILTPLGLSGPTGSVYASTRKKINTLACGGVAPVTASLVKPAIATTKAIVSSVSKKPVKKAPAQSAPKAQKGANVWLGTLFPTLSW